MILEFIEGRTMSPMAPSEAEARRMASSLRSLHAAPVFLKDFDMFRLTERYLRVCGERDIRSPRDSMTTGVRSTRSSALSSEAAAERPVS